VRVITGVRSAEIGFVLLTACLTLASSYMHDSAGSVVHVSVSYVTVYIQ
jgi:hypothetical protein